jgi:hypothetical protein
MVVVVATLAQAQTLDEFELPSFAADGGTTVSNAARPALDAGVGSPSSEVSSVTRAEPKPPRWPSWSLLMSFVLSGRTHLYLGLEGGIHAIVGLSPPEVKGPERQVEGWLLAPGIELLGARVWGPICAGTSGCGERWAFGGVLRAGHVKGFAPPDGPVRLSRYVFVGLGAHAATVAVPPAPLAAGSRWFEAVVRLKVGVEINTAPASARSKAAGFLIQASAFGEYLAFGELPGPQIGATVGLGF